MPGIPCCGAFILAVGRLLMQCSSCCTLRALVLYLGLELLYALRSRSHPSRSVQETLSLSPGEGGMLRSGENVTLFCSSEHTFDQFLLLRERENLGRPLAGGWGPHGALQAAFPLAPGTPAHSGAYRCYGSFTRSPYSWSDSSDPLLLSQVRNPFLAYSFLLLSSY